MRLALIFSVIGRLLRFFALAFLPPLVLAMGEGDWVEAGHFTVAGAATLIVGAAMVRAARRVTHLLRHEAMAVVAGTWLIVPILGGLPYLLSGFTPVGAFFESMSGFTTTGASILTDFEAHGRAFFLWRAMTQWFGGVGVIALFVVILPALGIAGRQLFFAEASAAPGEHIAPQVRKTAQHLWSLYAGLTLALVLGLVLCGYGIYDAVVHALTTLSAGGFSPHPRSIEGFANPSAEWVLAAFMFIAGISFPLLWRLGTGRVLTFFRDAEFLTYLVGMGAIALVLAYALAGGMPTEVELRQSAFQVASLGSQTGLASVDFAGWDQSAKALLVLAMLLGACAGSAGGGPKVIRWLLLFKFAAREVRQALHPQAVLPLRYKGRPMTQAVARSVITLTVLYVGALLLVGTVLTVAGETTLEEGLSGAWACLWNAGPGFGRVGPMGSYAHLSDFGKIVLSLAMWLGRLEILAILALLHPDAWRRTRWTGDVPSSGPVRAS